MKNVEFHSEKIRCPKCNKLQLAKVRHTTPFYTFIHNCEKCGYTIMESEWNTDKTHNFNDQGHTHEQRQDSYKLAIASFVAFIVIIAILVVAKYFGLLPEN